MKLQILFEIKNVEEQYNGAMIEVFDCQIWQTVFSSKDITGKIEDSQWNEVDLDISQYAYENSDLKIRFSMESDGSWEWSGWNIDNLQILGVPQGQIKNESLVASVYLEQNYPNPFNPTTSINFYLNNSNKVELSIYNTKGEMIQTLVKGFKKEGTHTVQFDASNLNSGVYYYTLKAADKAETRKMILKNSYRK